MAQGPFSVLLKINVPKSRTSPSFTPGHSESGQTGRQLAGSSEAAGRQTAQDRGARKKEERDPALEAPEHKGLEMRPLGGFWWEGLEKGRKEPLASKGGMLEISLGIRETRKVLRRVSLGQGPREPGKE